ncbi:MAG: hypothetical protein KAT49_00450 [Methanomicrobia archaeon]|nr:hypothetical protein [Methanomicrobia archaeon]
MMAGEIKSNLSPYIDENLIDDLLKYYVKIKKFQFFDPEKTGLNCAKFCETVLKILIFITEEQVIQKVYVSKTVDKLEKLPKSDFNDSIRIFIPRNVKVVYDIRNRRGIAHAGEIEPNYIDTTLSVQICDWILSELLRIYHVSDENKIEEIIMKITERKIPLIEMFGEDLVILEKNFSIKEKILLILYLFYPRMISNEDLRKWLKVKYSQIITSNLGNLESDILVYRKNRESTLTGKGLKYVEENFHEYLVGGVM